MLVVPSPKWPASLSIVHLSTHRSFASSMRSTLSFRQTTFLPMETVNACGSTRLGPPPPFSKRKRFSQMREAFFAS